MSTNTKDVPDDDPRLLSVTKVNCGITFSPFPVSCMCAFIPFFHAQRHAAFVPKNAWRSAISGVRALKRLKMSIGSTKQLRSELVVASGHSHGRLLLWNADVMESLNSATHYNNVSVAQILLTNTKIITVVERSARTGKEGDDADVFVFDMNTMELVESLSAHEDRVTCICVDPENENHLLTGSVDTTIIEWMLPSQIPLARYIGHTLPITRISFLFGRYFISGSADSTMRVWRTESELERPVELHPTRFTRRPLPQHIPLSSRQPSIAQRLPQREQVQLIDGHNGQISFLENMSDDGARGAVANGRLFTEKSLTSRAPIRRVVSIISACQGGLVRCSNVVFELKLDPRMTQNELKKLAATGVSSSDFALAGPVSLQWSNKAHKALVTDVTWDGPVIASCSTVDGVTFFHSESKAMHKITDFDTGVRHLAIDSMRKLLLCGCDNGQLSLFSYQGFYASHDPRSEAARRAAAYTEQIALLTAFQPHIASITGILIERSTNGQWERVITASADRTIFTMDFDTNRDAKVTGGLRITLPGPNDNLENVETGVLTNVNPGLHPSVPLPAFLSRTVAPIVGCGSFLLPSGVSAESWSVAECAPRTGFGKTLTTLAGQTENKGGHNARINAIRHYPKIHKILSGAQDGGLRFWQVVQATEDNGSSAASPGHTPGTQSPQHAFLNPADITSSPSKNRNDKSEMIRPAENHVVDFEQLAVLDFSPEEVDGVVAVSLQKNTGVGAYRTGAVVLVDAVNGRQTTNLLPTSFSVVNLHLLAYEVNSADASSAYERLRPSAAAIEAQTSTYKYFILAQLRTGEIIMYSGLQGHLNLQAVRTVVREQIPYMPDRDLDGSMPYPFPFTAVLNYKYSPPRIDLMHIDHNVLKSQIITTTADTHTNTLCNFTPLENVFGGPMSPPMQITRWTPIRQGGVLAAMSVAGGNVVILSEFIEANSNNTTMDKLQEYRTHDILYDGVVIDHQQEQPSVGGSAVRRRRGFVRVGSAGQFTATPECVAMCFSHSSRLLALGYADGLIQIWDAGSKIVCRRMHTHEGRPIAFLSLFGNEARLLSISTQRNNNNAIVGPEEIRMDTIHPRYLIDTSRDKEKEMVRLPSLKLR